MTKLYFTVVYNDKNKTVAPWDKTKTVVNIYKYICMFNGVLVNITPQPTINIDITKITNNSDCPTYCKSEEKVPIKFTSHDTLFFTIDPDMYAIDRDVEIAINLDIKF